MYCFRLFCLLICLILSGCDERAWNDPYPSLPATSNILFSAFSAQPKHLDPAKSYSSNESIFTGQIYEPVLQYNYLLVPYQLEPLIAEQMPEVSYDKNTDSSTYTIKIKPQIQYQPHPALAKDASGAYIYHDLSFEQADKYRNIQDFTYTGTRMLTSADYVYQIKRLADPKINSPIFGFFADKIIGMHELRAELRAAYKANPQINELDLRSFGLEGVKQIDEYTYQIRLHGQYAQFKYWLAMPFFAPVPWEATAFYNQPGFIEHNISLDWYPIGTGAFYLTANNPQRHMIMQRNPNFHPDYYPTAGMPDDAERGLLLNAGKRLPLLDSIVFSLEREDIPYWDKFIQGYYDSSGISADGFSSAVTSRGSSLVLTPELVAKGMRLEISSVLANVYVGFNMLDSTVGGYTERARKLRHAINLVFDLDEYIIIFTNGRGVRANGPIPPGILGYEPATKSDYNFNLNEAKRLLAEAGYPNGRDPITGETLQLSFDTMTSGEPDEKATFAWLRKQFAKLGIDLIINAMDYNRFQDKMSTGTTQMYIWGWSADYPDPENFLFLFYGPNGRVKERGENASNYDNPEFNQLFEQLKRFGDRPERLAIIQQMLKILHYDLPWIWGYFPQSFGLRNPWYNISKPNMMTYNTLKYISIDPQLRAQLRLENNQIIIWPFFVFIAGIVVILLPAIIGYRTSQLAVARRVE